jgi:hypothetical protein
MRASFFHGQNMKRQPKPFSVEIKRSRRSASTPASAQPSSLEMERCDADEAAPPPHFASRPGAGDSDLVVPAFLQAPNGTRRLTSRENSDAAAKDRDKVFAPVSPREPSNADQSGNKAPPRVLQSLLQPEAIHFPIDDMPVKRRTKQEKGDKPIERKTSVAREPETVVGSSARREVTASPKPAPARFAGEAIESTRLTVLIEPQLTRPRIFLNNGRADATTLPPGQRWKRRLHPRAW